MVDTSEIPYQADQEFDWDWNKRVTMSCWHELCFTGWPGWDRDPHKRNSQPYSRLLSIAHLESPSSRDLAVRFDSIANYQFYYRDFTDSGLPWTYEGEEYRSEFYFQSGADLVAFNHMVSDYVKQGETLEDVDLRI